MNFEPIDVDRALDELQRSLLAQPQVAREFSASRAEFARLSGPGADEQQARLAARRHSEWFVLERPSTALGGAPIEWALHHRSELGETALGEDELKALLSSRCGVFEVSSVTPGRGGWVRDLGAGGEYPLHEPEASREFQPGDLLVGRLFAVGDSLYSVSPAAGMFRNARLREALTRDIERLRQGRRGVLRLSQLELERMFYSDGGSREDVDAVARARTFLIGSGVSAEATERYLDELREASFEPDRWAHGVRDALASVMERLAFDHDVDLELARRLLLEAWPRLAFGPARRSGRVDPRNAGSAGSGARGDVRAAIEAFDRGRDAGRDLEQLFRDLERDLELEPEEIDPDGIDGAPAPDFPGVVGAMVQEFQWETECEHGAEALRELAPLAKFVQFGANVGVFENLGAHDLLLFGALWLPERGELESGAHAVEVLRALERFCEWSQRTQDVALHDAYREHIAPLEPSLARLADANRFCDRAGDAPEQGELFELAERENGGFVLRDRRGRERRAQLAAELMERLEVGDWVRATLEPESAARTHCCYPSQVARLAP